MFKNKLNIVIIFLFWSLHTNAQNHIAELFSDPVQEGNEAYLNGNYALASQKYEMAKQRDNVPQNIDLRIARSHYFAHHYQDAVNWYTQYLKQENRLEPVDQLYFAESNLSIGEKEKAIQYFEKYLSSSPNNTMVMAKIWRVNNLNYLFEDSLKNAVHFSEINTSYSDLQALNYENKVLLVSNRPHVNLIARIDENENSPFYHVMIADKTDDPFRIGAYFYNNINTYLKKLGNNYHIGPLSIYNNQQSIAYIHNQDKANKKGVYQLGLSFAKFKQGKWVFVEDFPFNDFEYSIYEASLNEAGDTLIFSSDKEGGFGGVDLYRSVKMEGNWTAPQNLGETINTELEERYPYLHSSGTLYFSSNGHPGMGGLDIYKVQQEGQAYIELENMGYPVNSSFDDFAFSIDPLKRQGFLTSNRARSTSDDIYEVDLNLQSYPLDVKGVVKFIEHNWMDSTNLELLKGVTLNLIDIQLNKVVASTITDQEGEFAFTVPNYSQYKIEVIGKDIEGTVSFEVPRYSKEDQQYEIVVVNDDFKQQAKGAE